MLVLRIPGSLLNVSTHTVMITWVVQVFDGVRFDINMRVFESSFLAADISFSIMASSLNEKLGQMGPGPADSWKVHPQE